MKYRNNIIIFAVGLVLASFSFYFDKAAFLIMDRIRNPVIDYLMGAVTHFGSVIVVLIFMTTLFLWGERKREWIPVLWLSFLISSAACIGLKMLVARPRPFELLIISFFGAVNYSFPSLHTTASFTAIEVLDREFPKFKWFWVLFAFMVAFSRVYLKLHYLSDVAFGALLGYTIGFILIRLEERFRLFRRL